MILGKGAAPEEVVIEAKGNSDIFLNSNADHVQLRNFTIEAEDGQHCAVMVHRGQAILKNCIVKNGDVGICVNSTSNIEVDKCKITGTKVRFHLSFLGGFQSLR